MNCFIFFNNCTNFDRYLENHQNKIEFLKYDQIMIYGKFNKNLKNLIQRLFVWDVAANFDTWLLAILWTKTPFNLENKENLNDKYQCYLNLFEQYKLNHKNIKVSTLSSIGIYSQHDTKLLYWTDRGYDEVKFKEYCKIRQSLGSPKSVARRKNISLEEAQKIVDKTSQKRQETLSKNPNLKDIYYSRGNGARKECWLKKINPETNVFFTEDELNIHHSKKYGWRLGLEYTETDRKTNRRCLEYYLDLAEGNEEKARKLYKNAQATFSLKRCIEKYGDEEGLIKWQKRQDKWQATLDAKSPEEKKEINRKKVERSNFYSVTSIKFFDKLIEKMNLTLPDNKFQIFYKNDEYYMYGKRFYLYDFTIKNLKFIIEYNGSHVHPNKEKMNSEQWNKWHNPYKKEITADIAYEFDKCKIDLAIDKGFDIEIVWDSDDENEAIEKC